MIICSISLVIETPSSLYGIKLIYNGEKVICLNGWRACLSRVRF